MTSGPLTEFSGESKLSDEIPVISLSGFEDVGGKREEICGKIVEACENWGMFQVIDHGVDTNLMADMTRLAREFFVLPLAEKLRFDMSGGKEGGFSVSSHLQVSNATRLLPKAFNRASLIYGTYFIW